MLSPAWVALVHFPEGKRVITLLEPPEVGKEVVAEYLAGWWATEVFVREGEYEGAEYVYEVTVNRSAAELPHPRSGHNGA